MNKITLKNPANPRETIVTSSMEHARLLLDCGWKRVEATVTKAEAKK